MDPMGVEDSQHSSSTLLLASVGGSPEPIVASLLHNNPDRVIFLASAETKANVPTILEAAARENFPLAGGAYDIHILDDPQDLNRCCRQLDELRDAIDQWLARGSDHRLVVDFTGGTKCMTAAIAMQVLRWPVHFSYVGGTERTKDNVGVVVSGTEKVLQFQNPWDVQGSRAVDNFRLLFDRGAFDACVKIMESTQRLVDNNGTKRELNALKELAAVYADWERFDHQGAATKLYGLQRSINDLKAVFANQVYRRLEKDWETHLQHLRTCAESIGPTQPLILDLLSNAIRREDEGRYEDAVARLYRSIEAIAQFRLRENHGIPETASVPLDRIPDRLRNQWQPRAEEGVLKLGLQDAYLLLAELSDPTGARFREMQWDTEKSPLVVRNVSILAHGFSRVTQANVAKLREGACELLQIRQGDLIRFPRLGEVST